MSDHFKNLIGFIKSYSERDFLRLHVPGHQGRCTFLNNQLAARFDITEVAGADWLFDSCGILQELEEELSLLFGQSAAISTCGSTLCVQTMVALCKNRVFIAHRNSAHVSFFNACALLGVRVQWFGCDENFGLNSFNLNEIRALLSMHKKGTCAIYLTSPDYFGLFAPVEQIAKVCKEFEALLLVDCAHGAHLNFIATSTHPAKMGADLSCSSLHKTLPTLTGAAVLNFNEKLFSKAKVKETMATFSTTSPSYLIMSSISFCVSWLQKHGEQEFDKLAKRKQRFVENLQLPVLQTDVAKLVIDCRAINLTGLQLAEILRSNRIEPEFANVNFLVMVLSPFLNDADWKRLKACLSEIRFEAVNLRKRIFSDMTQNILCAKNNDVVELSLVFDRPTERIKLNEQAVGRICAKTKFKSPPGTVTVAAGERLSSSLVCELNRHGLTQLEVVL